MRRYNRILICLIFTLSIYDAQAQKKSNVQYLITNINNTEYYDFFFLMTEINESVLIDSSFFKSYQNRIHALIKVDYNIITDIILYSLSLNFDSVLISKNKNWKKERFKILKSLTPLNKKIDFTEKNIRPLIDFSTDETGVEDAILYYLFLYDAEKLFQLFNGDSAFEKDVMNWKENVIPFGSCDYFFYKPLLERQKKFIIQKYGKTTNPKLKSVIELIKRTVPEC